MAPPLQTAGNGRAAARAGTWRCAVRAARALFVVGVALNWLRRWAYTARMPLIPGLGLGLTPILQLLPPPLIFGIVGRWRGAAGSIRPRG